MEFIWDDGSLSIEPSVEGPAIKITKDMATESVLKMKEGIVCGLSGIVIGTFKAGGDAMLDVITDLINLTIKEQQIPENWDQSTIMELWWSLRKLGVDQWLIRLVKAMYSHVPENFCQIKIFPSHFQKNTMICLVFENENKWILKV